MSRTRLLAEKVLALAVLSLPVPLASLVATVTGRGFHIELPMGALVASTLLASAMAFDFGLLALALGAWSGNRGTAVGVTAALAATSYLVSSLAPAAPWVHAIRYVSPIYWSLGANQIQEGATVVGTGLLVLLGIAAATAGRAAIARLDIH